MKGLSLRRASARQVWLGLAVAMAVTAALALSRTSFHVVPTRTGEWRGLLDPPGGLRLGWALVAGLVVAWLLRRRPSPCQIPVLAFALAVAPFVPVLTGRALGFLVFQGPVLGLLLAVVGVVVGLRLAGSIGTPRGAVPSWALFALALSFSLVLLTRVPGPSGPQGDEPHFLVMAHSLMTDGDLDLTNQYAERQYLPFFGGTLRPHTSPAAPPGRIYSAHAPGMAALLLPAYALGGDVGARVLLLVLSAIAGVLLRAVALEAGASERTALATWAIVTFTPPFAFYALSLYPETVAFCGVTLLLWLRRGEPRSAAALAAAAVAGALVWFHPKFLPIGAVALGLVLLRARGWTPRALAAAVYGLVLVGFLMYMQQTYGRASFAAGFGPSNLTLRLLPRGVLAQLFDRQWGVFAVAPVFMLAVPGVVSRLREKTLDTLGLLALAAVPIAIGGSYGTWWGGLCPAGRFPLPALPVMAVFLSVALPRRRDLAAALSGLGLGFVVVTALTPHLLRNPVPGESSLLHHLATYDLNGLLPSFFDPRPLAPVLLSLSLAAAFALAWRHGARGFVVGVLAYGLVASSVRERPPIDAREATLGVLWKWDRDNGWGPRGPLDPGTLAVPLEMRHAPWEMGPGDARRSRGVDLPAGAYALSVRVDPRGEGPGRLAFGARARGVVVARGSRSTTDERPLPVLLPVGAPGFRFEVAVETGSALVRNAAVIPTALVARRDRTALVWPRRLPADLYRTPRGAASVTVGPGFVAEGDGFRLSGTEGSLVVDGPATLEVAVSLRRMRLEPEDELQWADRAVPLGRLTETVVRLPMAEGLSLGRSAVVPLHLRAPGAWIRVHGHRGPGRGVTQM